MSRLAKKPLQVPDKVQINILTDKVEIKGPKGELTTPIPTGISIRHEDTGVYVDRENDWPSRKANQGLAFSLLRNAIVGVTDGFKKELEIVGIGYKAAMQGKSLNLSLGYSHSIDYPVPDGITIDVPQPTRIMISGNDKQQVGQVAAEIRAFRKPEVYKGKGIRYVDEIIRKKAGKQAI